MNLKFWKSQEIEQPKEEAPKRAGGFFSLDKVDLMTKEEKLALLEIQKIDLNAFPPPSKEMVSNGKAVAMDTAIDAAKNAYAISTSNVAENLISWYALQGFIGYQVCALIAQHWLVDKACTMPGKDAIRKGYDITRNDGEELEPEVLDLIRKLDKKYRVKENLVEAVRFSNIFGIRVVIFQVDSTDPQYYEKPFNIDGVKKGTYRGMSQVDPYWMTPEATYSDFSDPARQDFYTPLYWRVGSKRYHRSHLKIIIPTPVADILKPTYIYGGISVPQKIYERVYAAEATANEAPLLAKTKRLTVLKMDIETALSNMTKFAQRMLEWVSLRDNYGVKVIGGEEEVDQHDTTLTDLDETIMSQYQLVASIANVPSTKLLGTSPKGFQSTGEYDEANYHEYLESIQQDVFDPILDRHYSMMMKSDFDGQLQGKKFEIIPKWHELDSMTAKERAEVNEIQSRADMNLVNSGALLGTDVRARIIGDPHSRYNGIEKLEDVDKDEQKEISELMALATTQTGSVAGRPENEKVSEKSGKKDDDPQGKEGRNKLNGKS